VAALDQRNGVLRQPRRIQPGTQRLDDGPVGIDRTGTAPQQTRVARLQADTGRVGGDVWTCLVDDPYYSQRYAHLVDMHAVGQLPATNHLADRIGQAGQRPQTDNHAVYAGLSQAQPIDEGL